jgi:hypothetical protein
MSVVVGDLVAPDGPIEPPLFPGEGDGTSPSPLFIRLSSYLAQAEAKASGIAFPDPDEAISAWALYLSFHAAYMVAVARPATENSMVPVLGSDSYQKDQRDALLAAANEYKAIFNQLLVAVPDATVQPIGAPTRSTPLEFEY